MSPYPTVKLFNYFSIYAKLFGHLRGKACTFIEIGVLEGGSLFMWREWLGTKARIIGVDLNPEALKWEKFGFEIVIGDQGDKAFWDLNEDTFKGFDVLLDDGGHQSFQQILTSERAIAIANKQSVIVIEDTHSNFMKDFSRHGRLTFIDYAKALSDLLPLRAAKFQKKRFQKRVDFKLIDSYNKIASITFYAGMVVFNISPVSGQEESNLVRNRESLPISDFRYNGANYANISWPSIRGIKQRRVKGGRNLRSLLVLIAKKIIPENIIFLLRK